MGAKVNFNEITKIIEVTLAPDVNGEIFIDVKEDLYSDGKEDWINNENLRKFYFPIEAVGGNPLPGSKALGSTFFLASDWKIRPYNTSHRLIINGNLYSQDGSDPFLDSIGNYTIRIMQQVSSLVDSTVQQLTEIEYASFNGGISIDVSSPYSGIVFPIGTPQQPVNNLTDALTIANNRGFGAFFVTGNLVVNNSGDYSSKSFIGESVTKTTINVNSNANVARCEFYDCTLEGFLDGEAMARGCRINDLEYVNGVLEQCILDQGVITLGGGAVAHFLDCWSGAPQGSTPTIDLGDSGQSLSLRNFSGAIALRNKSGMEEVGITLIAGKVILENTVTNGKIYISGVGTLEDNSSGASVDVSALLSTEVITAKIWDEPTADRQIPGTIGGDYYNMIQSFPRILGLNQENFKMDNQTYQEYNGGKLLTSARIRIYVDNTLSVVLATYQVTAAWSEGQCTSYQVVKS